MMRIERDMRGQLAELAAGVGRFVERRTAIYLDTRFWIILRDAQRGIGDSKCVEMLARLRGAVADGRIVCPASLTIVDEVARQSDPTSRGETVRLIDELSAGVGLLSGPERIATEIAHLIHEHAQALTGEELHPLRHLVWTRGLGLVGMHTPYCRAFDFNAALLIQRATVERLWRDVQLSDIIEGRVRRGDPNTTLMRLAERLNSDVERCKDRLVSFEATLEDEIRGAADACCGVAVEIFADLAERNGHCPPAPDDAEWSRLEGVFRVLLAAALRLTPAQERLRSLRVAAALHAALRWNKGHKFNANHLRDFDHAAAGLSYCEAFLTDGPLRHMLTAGNVRLDRKFGCRVVSDVDEAIDLVANL